MDRQNARWTVEELYLDVLTALRAWTDSSAGQQSSSLAALFLVREELQNLNAQASDVTLLAFAVKKVLHRSLKLLDSYDSSAASLLRSRFQDKATVIQVAQKQNISQATVFANQRKAINLLCTFLLREERKARSEKIASLQAVLPAEIRHRRLFGIEDKAVQLYSALSAESSPWILCIVGIGGIGKTTLAAEVARRLVSELRYEELIWLKVASPQGKNVGGSWQLSAAQLQERLVAHFAPRIDFSQDQNQQRHQLRHLLTSRTQSTLIIVDNLEEAPTQDAFELMRSFTNPSRFLLTSRTNPVIPSNVASYVLPEISKGALSELIIQQATHLGISALQVIDEGIFDKFHAVTGGNPLAIKLVVSLCTFFSLADVLADLQAARTSDIEEMYNSIYKRIWLTLTDSEKTLLQASILASSDGFTRPQLEQLTALDDDDLPNAIRALVARSLLEIGGTAIERRYSTHQLTKTFIATDIIQLESWQ